MKICVVGGGAIGSLTAYFLYRSGVFDIVVYYRSWNSVNKVMENSGITVVRGDKEYLVPVIPRHYSKPFGKCDVVFNAVKAYDVVNTIPLIKQILDFGGLVISMQNGFGSLELLEKYIGFHSVAGAVVKIGAERIAPNIVVERGIGEIILGQHMGIHPYLYEINYLLNKGGCPTRISSNIDFERWLKLAINAVINSLTAIAKARNKIVLSSYGRKIASMILDEVVKAAYLEGYKLDFNRLYKHVMRIAEATSNNYSSMAQDIMNKRITEIDYINGFVAKILEERGEKAFVNKLITYIIHLIEEQTIKH